MNHVSAMLISHLDRALHNDATAVLRIVLGVLCRTMPRLGKYSVPCILAALFRVLYY
jgi:hypothetical protein